MEPNETQLIARASFVKLAVLGCHIAFKLRRCAVKFTHHAAQYVVSTHVRAKPKDCAYSATRYATDARSKPFSRSLFHKSPR